MNLTRIFTRLALLVLGAFLGYLAIVIVATRYLVFMPLWRRTWTGS